jgi:hypothetical protein
VAIEKRLNAKTVKIEGDQGAILPSDSKERLMFVEEK